MLKDITLGQYFPGDTLAHKLDPRTKLLITVLYIVALFTAKSYLAYGILVLTLVIAVRISRVSVKALFKGLKPVLFIIAFTAVLNLFYTPGKEIWHFWIFHMTLEGVRAAVTMMLRITLLIMGTFLLTYTTSPIRLTDGLESLLGPLKAIKLPVHELAMMMSIALRFIPTLIEETDKIMSAQKARGADFETGSLMQRAKALVPLLVPLFVSAFPFVARMVESSLNEVDAGLIEAAQSMGSTTMQIIRKVLLPEALPSLISGAAICVTTILAYTAMAGAAGGDGLGKIAITYGLNRREYGVMYAASIALVVLVQVFQLIGNILTKALDHRHR